MGPEEASRVTNLMIEEMQLNGFENFDVMKVLVEAVGNGEASTDA
jgi:hypothetical protein